MKKKYVIDKTTNVLKIFTVQVQKETSYSMWIDGKRYRKVDRTHTTFDGFADAKAELVRLKKEQVKKYKIMLEGAVDGLKRAGQLKSAAVEEGELFDGF